MTLTAYTAMHPVKAAEELREDGFTAFAVMMLDRRRKARTIKAKVAKPIVALQGYVFVTDPNAWKLSRMRHVGQPVRFAGRTAVIPPRQAQWLMNPPQGLFHDNDPPLCLTRPDPPLVKVGDTVRLTLACERVEAPVLQMSPDGHTLLLRIAMLGRETMRVPLSMVETVAA
jgi:hypothetical protein